MLLPMHVAVCWALITGALPPSVRRAVTMTDRKAVIKNADMSEEMQQDAVDCATNALEKYNIEKVGLTCCGLY